jgi:hypothetical protein
LDAHPPTWTARLLVTPNRPSCLFDKEIFEYIRGFFKEYLENMSSMSSL